MILNRLWCSTCFAVSSTVLGIDYLQSLLVITSVNYLSITLGKCIAFCLCYEFVLWMLNADCYGHNCFTLSAVFTEF